MPSDRAASFGVQAGHQQSTAQLRRRAAFFSRASSTTWRDATWPATSSRAARSSVGNFAPEGSPGEAEAHPVDVSGRVLPQSDPAPVPERAGKGLLSDVLGCRPVEAAELEARTMRGLVHLVDRDEVARHVGMGSAGESVSMRTVWSTRLA